jgi:demethylmenaquinone methyltransferase/2-methoxy-6-polyprenyl-1,4-benzoquinol methylase
MEGKYFNEGWFGKHPVFYELASQLLEPFRRRAARVLGSGSLRILDIGTGTGALAYTLARAGHIVTGVDLDARVLVYAVRKQDPHLALDFRHCDATDLPFDRNSFDAATLSFAMHDVPQRICLGILREARRVLRADGMLVILDYQEVAERIEARMLRWAAFMYESPNYHAFVRRSTVDTLQSAGFRVLSRQSILGAVQLTTAR